MEKNVFRWAVDLAMGIVFIICFVTGLLKFTVLMRLTGLSELVLPVALISDLHDWSGIVLGILVAAHLFLNRRWITAMTVRILGGSGGQS